MKISLRIAPTAKQKSALIFGLYDDHTLSPSLQQLDQSLKGYISQLIKQGLIPTTLGSVFPLSHPDYHAPILIVGCGKKTEWRSSQCREMVNRAFKSIQAMKIAEMVCYFTELPVAHQSLPTLVKQLVEIIDASFYRFDQFKSKKEPIYQKEITLHLPDAKQQKACEQAFKQGLAVANGVTLTKNLANSPSNICTPLFIANEAKKLAKAYKSFSITVLNKKEMEKLGMGALLGVAEGSRQEPQLICLEYQGTHQKEAPVALVGKGVTFDTGGNSLKPPDSMVGMKYDMCGAASVLGTLKAVAELALPINLVGVIPAVENMPGGGAYKPEDILTSLSGQTIEVISTDAEGRLILADALTYCERFKPDVVIDIATLTGAVVVALGHHATGLLSNDDRLATAILKAGIESADRAWQLPLWEEYQEQIKSPFADMANLGGRAAGTITAACFLSRFATPFRWAHLDVAGTAAMMSGTTERRATGRPVPLLVQYLIDRLSH